MSSRKHDLGRGCNGRGDVVRRSILIVGPKRINKRLPPSCPHASKDELLATSLSGAEQTAQASTIFNVIIA
ncbi:hypothetical protein DY000_02002524 [Brassica cretica]|uniref:Uncharacterized protein n=1 Tax=Brassica cretica TaxID=69181 RepID=A0ABQ7C8Y5_BRACR|nr:hypothetical protein DY000_02002524 [Brassica cretica]